MCKAKPDRRRTGVLGFRLPKYLSSIQNIMTDFTLMLQTIEHGDARTANELLTLGCDELRRVCLHTFL
jgi:hypothetical protein